MTLQSFDLKLFHLYKYNNNNYKVVFTQVVFKKEPSNLQYAIPLNL